MRLVSYATHRYVDVLMDIRGMESVAVSCFLIIANQLKLLN